MNRRYLNLAYAGLVCVAALANAALGGIALNEWNVNDTNKWNYNPITGVLTITDTDTDIFSFEAYDDVTGEPAHIDTIKVVDTGLTGTVRVRVAQNPGNNPATTRGAASVRVIDLTNADVGELVELDISGSLGRISSTNGYVTVADVSGNLVIDGNVYNAFTAGDITGAMLGALEPGARRAAKVGGRES